jgi:DNA-binding XRE family transcriptional regulator
MKLNEWMRVHGYTIPRLAGAIEVDQATVWRWLRGKTCPNVRQANRIAVLTEGAVGSMELETTWVGWEPPVKK